MSAFLNFISDMKTPKGQIGEAVESDNVQQLISLLEKYPQFNNEKNELYIHKNILHYSISERAVSCVYHLVDKAKWSITESMVSTNERDWNAIMYAFVECYFPILYFILRRYCGTERPSTLGTWSTLRGWLPQTAPHFCLVYQLLTPDEDNRNLLKQKLRDGEFMPMSPHPVYLATELILSDDLQGKTTTPQTRANLNNPSESWTPYEALGVNAGCDSELDMWWKELSRQPLLLSEITRRTVRLSILQASGKTGACGRENYFHRVDRLPLPEMIKRYLCYADLWPMLSKDDKIMYVRRGVSQWKRPEPVFMDWEPYNLDERGHYLE